MQPTKPDDNSIHQFSSRKLILTIINLTHYQLDVYESSEKALHP